MPVPYGLNVINDCWSCPVRAERLFCNLSAAALNRLNEIKSTAVYPKSAILFLEREKPRGIFVLCSGKAKLSVSSSDGKVVILKVSGPGDILGLNAVIAGREQEATAEMVEPGQANFIAREDLMEFLRDHGEVALRVAEQLSRNYYSAYEEIRTLGLSRSPSEKFARLLLSWSGDASADEKHAQLRMILTHEEIAGLMGTTRETVSRLFSDFNKKQLLQVKGSALTILNRPAIEKMVSF